eukprot:COSAG04_NODE_9566_length_851_cov_1.093085_1_plen_189_part_00
MLLQLVRTPLAILGGAPQGHEELEWHDCAIEDQSDGSERSQEPSVGALPARSAQRVKMTLCAPGPGSPGWSNRSAPRYRRPGRCTAGSASARSPGWPAGRSRLGGDLARPPGLRRLLLGAGQRPGEIFGAVVHCAGAVGPGKRLNLANQRCSAVRCVRGQQWQRGARRALLILHSHHQAALVASLWLG